MQHDRQLCNANKGGEQRDEQSTIGGYLHTYIVDNRGRWVAAFVAHCTGLPKPMINTAECFESQSMT